MARCGRLSHGAVSLGLCALSGHLSTIPELPSVSYLLVSNIFSVPGMLFMGVSSPWNEREQLTVQCNGFCVALLYNQRSSLPYFNEQVATFPGSEAVFPGDSSLPRVDMSRPFPLCGFLSQHKLGAFSMPCQVFACSPLCSLDGSPREQEPFLGAERRCSNESADTFVYSGMLPGPAVIEKGAD